MTDRGDNTEGEDTNDEEEEVEVGAGAGMQLSRDEDEDGGADAGASAREDAHDEGTRGEEEEGVGRRRQEAAEAIARMRALAQSAAVGASWNGARRRGSGDSGDSGDGQDGEDVHLRNEGADAAEGEQDRGQEQEQEQENGQGEEREDVNGSGNSNDGSIYSGGDDDDDDDGNDGSIDRNRRRRRQQRRRRRRRTPAEEDEDRRHRAEWRARVSRVEGWGHYDGGGNAALFESAAAAEEEEEEEEEEENNEEGHGPRDNVAATQDESSSESSSASVVRIGSGVAARPVARRRRQRDLPPPASLGAAASEAVLNAAAATASATIRERRARQQSPWIGLFSDPSPSPSPPLSPSPPTSPPPPASSHSYLPAAHPLFPEEWLDGVGVGGGGGGPLQPWETGVGAGVGDRRQKGSFGYLVRLGGNGRGSRKCAVGTRSRAGSASSGHGFQNRESNGRNKRPDPFFGPTNSDGNGDGDDSPLSPDSKRRPATNGADSVEGGRVRGTNSSSVAAMSLDDTESSVGIRMKDEEDTNHQNVSDGNGESDTDNDGSSLYGSNDDESDYSSCCSSSSQTRVRSEPIVAVPPWWYLPEDRSDAGAAVASATNIRIAELPILELDNVTPFPGSTLPLRLRNPDWVNYLGHRIDEARLGTGRYSLDGGQRPVQIGVVPRLSETRRRTHRLGRRGDIVDGSASALASEDDILNFGAGGVGLAVAFGEGATMTVSARRRAEERRRRALDRPGVGGTRVAGPPPAPRPGTVGRWRTELLRRGIRRRRDAASLAAEPMMAVDAAGDGEGGGGEAESREGPVPIVPPPPQPPADRLVGRIGTVATITYTHEGDADDSSHGEANLADDTNVGRGGGRGRGGGGFDAIGSRAAPYRSRVWNRRSGQLVLTALGTGRFRILKRIDGEDEEGRLGGHGGHGGGGGGMFPGAPRARHLRGFGDMADIKLYVVEELEEGGFSVPPPYLRDPHHGGGGGGGDGRGRQRSGNEAEDGCGGVDAAAAEGEENEESESSPLLRARCHSSALRHLSRVTPIPEVALRSVWPWRLAESIVSELLRDDAAAWEGLKKSLPSCSGLVTIEEATTTVATAVVEDKAVDQVGVKVEMEEEEEKEKDDQDRSVRSNGRGNGGGSRDSGTDRQVGESDAAGGMDDGHNDTERGRGGVVACCCRIGGSSRVGSDHEGENAHADRGNGRAVASISTSGAGAVAFAGTRSDAGGSSGYGRDGDESDEGADEEKEEEEDDDVGKFPSSRTYFDPARCDPSAFSHWLSANLPLPDLDRIDLLESHCPVQRLRFLLGKIVRQRSVDRAVRCKRCGSVISRVSRMFTVGGAEGTTGAYVNAHGVVHQTITVRSVDRDSVLCYGYPEARDSWFPGYSWTIAHCYLCHSHLGWKFLPADMRRRQRRRRHADGSAGGDLDPEEDPSRPDLFWGLSGASVTTDESAGTSPRRVFRGRFPLDWVALTFGQQDAGGSFGDVDEESDG